MIDTLQLHKDGAQAFIIRSGHMFFAEPVYVTGNLSVGTSSSVSSTGAGIVDKFAVLLSVLKVLECIVYCLFFSYKDIYIYTLPFSLSVPASLFVKLRKKQLWIWPSTCSHPCLKCHNNPWCLVNEANIQPFHGDQLTFASPNTVSLLPPPVTLIYVLPASIILIADRFCNSISANEAWLWFYFSFFLLLFFLFFLFFSFLFFFFLKGSHLLSSRSQWPYRLQRPTTWWSCVPQGMSFQPHLL